MMRLYLLMLPTMQIESGIWYFVNGACPLLLPMEADIVEVGSEGRPSHPPWPFHSYYGYLHCK